MTTEPKELEDADIEAPREGVVASGVAQSQRQSRRKIALGIFVVVAAILLVIGLSVGLTQRTDEPCNVSRYDPKHSPATCKELTRGKGHTNSYWENQNFLCRTNERPCEATSPILRIDLSNVGMNLKQPRRLNFDIGDYDFGPAEVWHVRTDRLGEVKMDPWNSPYRFYSESRWQMFDDSNIFNGDFNDYRFGSLECLGPQDADDFVFIVIDGVLVDSCPKSVAEECRICKSEAHDSPGGCEERKWHYSSWIEGCANTDPSNEQAFNSLRDCCLFHFGSGICISYDMCADFNADRPMPDPPLLPEPLTPQPSPVDLCEELLEQDRHTNSYWENTNFLCRTNERPCEATSSSIPEMDLGSTSFRMTIKFDTEHSDYGPSEVWHVRTDSYGNTKMSWNSPYRFYSESQWQWFNASNVGNWDFNDYRFGSLECLDPQDADDFVFIVIDGVLVDSCPKSVAEECRICESRECGKDWRKPK